MDLSRQLKSTALILFLITLIFQSTSSRYHGTRQKRQYGANIYLPETYIIPDGEGSNSRDWSDWSSPSECSRSCGGGVTYQTRECLRQAPNGELLCEGGNRKFYSCNTQDCPENEQDFRVQQCSRFDNIPFEGVRYEWIPYKKAPNPCELNCMPRGERFYYRHKAKVIDGTRCNDESLDICVDGKCEPVGCDMMLGSSAREDKCRKCAGDGTSCQTVSGLLDMNNLQVGYNDILLVPSGATNIDVHEISPSNNYLACRNLSSHYYLNGNWRIDFPRPMSFAGTWWHYDRKPQGFAAPDHISSMGPTSEPIYIVLLYQDRNVGIQYEYSIPENSARNEPDTYAWTHTAFGPCSSSCGGGDQTREVMCNSRTSLERVDDSLCDSSSKPSDSQQCGEQECAPHWVQSEWNKCSKSCGEDGKQNRTIHCEKTDKNGAAEKVDDSVCLELAGNKPADTRECNRDVKNCPKFHIGPWKPCDKLCGEGKQLRKVTCFKEENGKKTVLSSEECSEQKPEEEQTCLLQPCDGVDWILSPWSGCDGCTQKEETRTAVCSDEKGKTYDEKFCSEEKPEITRKCKASNKCEFQWFSSEWSKCSAPCGKGVQSRTVVCGQYDGKSVIPGDESKCKTDTKPEIEQDCDTSEEECPGQWFYGPWAECDKPCGGGNREREVLCLANGEISVNCKEDDVVFAEEKCNEAPCSEDEVLSVDGSSTTIGIDEEELEDCDESGEDEDIDSVTDKQKEDLKVSEGFELDDTSATESSLITDDLMLSDATGLETDSTGSSDASTDLPESTIEGSGETDVSVFSTEGSGDDDSTTTSGFSDLSSDATSSIETEKTESSGSTDTSDTTTDSNKSTDVSDVTDLSTASVDVTTDSTDDSSATGSSKSSDETSDATGGTTGTKCVKSVSAEDGGDEASECDGTDAPEETSPSFGSSTTTNDVTSTPFSTEEITSTPFTTETSSESTETSTDTSSSSSESSTDTTTDSSDQTSDISSTGTDSTQDTSHMQSSTEQSQSTDEQKSTGSMDTEDTVTASDITTEVTGSTDLSDSTEKSISTEESFDETGSTDQSVTTDEAGSTDISGSTETSGSTEAPESTETAGSTDSLGSTESSASTDSSQSTGSEAIESSESTESTQSGSTGESESTESTAEFTTTSGMDESSTVDIWSSSDSSGSTDESEATSSTLDIFLTTKGSRKCKPKKKVECNASKFGCCPDQKTAAKGPFDKGCPVVHTCKETKHGCCADGVSPAKGKNNKGCPKSQCAETLFGCCADKYTPAEGENDEGCPEPTTTEAPTTLAMTPKPKEDDKKTCEIDKYGCCPDGKTSAQGENGKGCEDEQVPDDCRRSIYGCCPDGRTASTGPNNEGCEHCESSRFGCCRDQKTPAHGPYMEGCCLDSPFGCCPDNINAARGPNNEGCDCKYSPYGCCPDQNTAARGYDNLGCGCENSQFGCCPDKITVAQGEKFEGCPCHTMQFGCCPDGITIPQGPHHYGCHCSQTEHKCCPDEKTAAKGPNFEGCTCAEGKFGCCPDGVSNAEGPKFEGCENVAEAPQKACALPKETGSCNSFVIRHFFDTAYGACARFWYGGCDGNGNNFETNDDCKATCEEYKGKESCLLPRSTGPCQANNQKWYYDSERNQCQEFTYGGCYGNTNRFDSREECQSFCAVDESLPPCDQPSDRGPCEGNFERWYYDNETDVCRQFNYGGCKGNKNNYVSEHACTYHCKQPGVHKEQCSLPKENGNASENFARWYYSERDQKCMPFYYTGAGGNKNNYESLEQCEEKCPKQVAKTICEIPAEVGECQDYVARWYYDTKDERCRQFYWGSCGGNENNFADEESCTKRCEKPVEPEKPEPIPEPQPPVERPQPEHRADEYEPDTRICFLSSDAGPCREDTIRYYYNKDEGVCDVFAYGGCDGNENNFASEEECENRCFQAQETCSLFPLRGRCNENTTRWYYDERSSRCYEFEFTGCGGNRNNFFSEKECIDYCRRSDTPAFDTRFSEDDFDCKEPSASGNCQEQILSYYYNIQRGACEPFYYSGCDGNRNRFESYEQCEKKCGSYRNNDIDVCSLPQEQGPCVEWQTKFYFNSQSRICEPFTYGGCEGNDNRFSTTQECESVCIQRQEPNTTDDKALCYLQADIGQCTELGNGETRRWYYDDSRGTCAPFIYSGCSGNKNNFMSLESCVDFCANPVRQPQPHVPEEEQCHEYRIQCQNLRCHYSVRREVDQSGCEHCECENPCDNHRCPADSSCVVDRLERDYIPVCRQINKPGDCPQLSNSSRCDTECNNDVDCHGDTKCCYDGCGYVCIQPVEPDYHRPLTDRPILRPGEIPVQLEPKHPDEVDVDQPAGGAAVLRCFATGYPAPTITWRFGSIVIDTNQGRYVLTSSGDLTIVQVHQADSGIYVCVADNGLGEPVHRDVRLTVQEPKDTEAYIYGPKDSTKVVMLNQPTQLRCPAGGYPNMLVTWWRGKTRLALQSENFEVNRDYSLVFHNVRLQDLGVYTCEAYSGHGRPASIKITLKAFGPYNPTHFDEDEYLQYIVVDSDQPIPQHPYPHHTTSPPYRPPQSTQHPYHSQNVPASATIEFEPTNTYTVGSEVVMFCKVEGVPIPNVTWTKNDIPLETSEKVQIYEYPNRLVLYNAQLTDTGHYGCTARNNFSYNINKELVTIESKTYVDPDCIDNPYFANCELIVKGHYCTNRYYGKFCCRSCVLAGQIQHEPHPNAINK